MSESIDVLDGSFAAQCERIRRLVTDNCVTPELGSLMLHYYAMGREEASGEKCDATKYAIENFNPNHIDSLHAYRLARPAKLLTK